MTQLQTVGNFCKCGIFLLLLLISFPSVKEEIILWTCPKIWVSDLVSTYSSQDLAIRTTNIAVYLWTGLPCGKEPDHQCRRWKKCRSDPWLGISPGGGYGNPLQCSCLENPMDRGAWRAMVYRVAKSCSDLAYSTHGVNNSSYIFTLKTLLQQVFPNPASWHECLPSSSFLLDWLKLFL